MKFNCTEAVTKVFDSVETQDIASLQEKGKETTEEVKANVNGKKSSSGKD